MTITINHLASLQVNNKPVIMGCAMQQGTTGLNIGRLAALAGGLPTLVSGMSIDRQCSSGLMSIATAAKQIVHDGMHVTIGAGPY